MYLALTRAMEGKSSAIWKEVQYEQLQAHENLGMIVRGSNDYAYTLAALMILSKN
jgi:hypothetical protein